MRRTAVRVDERQFRAFFEQFEDVLAREVDAEWIDYGKLKATDENGNEYELEAE